VILTRQHTALFVLLLLVTLSLPAEPPKKYRHKRSGNGLRINFGTSLNTYNINDKHGYDPKQKFATMAGFRREMRVSRDYKTYILVGADYSLHGVKYRSYFFKADTIHVYDKKFNYDYNVYFNEILIPVQMKYLLRREDNSLFSPYLLVGYQFEIMLPANVKVSRDGKLYKDDFPEVKFRTHLISEKVNATGCLAIGWQKNNLSDNRGSFFAELNFQYGFSDYYFDTDYSARSMFINCIHATLLIGSKF